MAKSVAENTAALKLYLPSIRFILIRYGVSTHDPKSCYETSGKNCDTGVSRLIGPVHIGAGMKCPAMGVLLDDSLLYM